MTPFLETFITVIAWACCGLFIWTGIKNVCMYGFLFNRKLSHTWLWIITILSVAWLIALTKHPFTEVPIYSPL